MAHNIKVFLVDGDLVTLNEYRQGLENFGYRNINLFLNGVICLNNLHQKPKIIFLNHSVEDAVSFDILKKIKQSQLNVYVIIISNQENVNIAVDAMKYGAFDYIIKGDNEITKMKNVIERIILLGK
ncbi:MAG: response regulator [Bacteroidia bacterium]|nr:response regulator [Bacteroidia bacterium]